MSAPVLAYPDPNKEYLHEMDALKLGLGAMLSQKQSNGRYHPVAFRSRALHGVEVNYHSTKLKFLAMKWSIEHFQTYLLGHHFKVHMDNNPLTYFLTSPNMDAKKERWINELAGGLLYYRYKPKYQIEEVKCFIVPRAHRRTAIDGYHHDAGHQGKKRTDL